MPAIPWGPLGRQELAQISEMLRERIRRNVSIDVWTRPAGSGLLTTERDAEEHGAETLALMRQIVGVHPGLTITPYDLDKHADRATKAGIELSPTVVVRSGGRSIHFVGMFYGPLFGRFLDAVGFLAAGASPLTPESRQVLGALEADVEIEAFVTPFEPFSERLMPLLAAVAAEAKHVRVRMIEAAQFPVFAGKRLVTQVPLLVMNGKRIVGYWEEPGLVEQIRRVAAGDDAPVVRERVLVAEYISEEDARRLSAERQQGGGAPPAPRTTSSGLILPGQD